MSMPLQQRSYMTDSYSQALSAIYTYYDRVRDPSYALSQDVDIYEIMLRDPKVHQGVQDRLTSVAGPDWRVFPFNNSKDPADIALAKLVDDAFRFVPHFAETRMRLATAIFRGQSCELMTGKRKRIRLGMMRVAEPVWMMNETKNIDPRRFTIRPRRTELPNGKTQIDADLYMSTIPTWANPPVADTDYMRASNLSAYGYRKVDHPEWLIRVIYGNDEASLGFGRGLDNPIYFYHWLKQILLREGLQGVERWAQGIVVGTLDPDAPGSPDAQTTEAQKTAMLDALTKMRSRHVYVQGKHDDIQVVTGGGEGHQMVMGMIDYIDDCIMAVCTGAVLMSSKSNAGDAGSHARDEVGANTQNKIVASDQKKIDEDISTWAVGLWVRQNWKLICKYGLQNARLPQIKTVQPKASDPDKFATRVSAMWQANPKFKVRKDEAYEGLGLTPVNEEEDEWVEGADPAAAAGPGDPNDPSAMMMEPGQGAPTPQAAMRAAPVGLTPYDAGLRARGFKYVPGYQPRMSQGAVGYSKGNMTVEVGQRGGLWLYEGSSQESQQPLSFLNYQALAAHLDRLGHRALASPQGIMPQDWANSDSADGRPEPLRAAEKLDINVNVTAPAVAAPAAVGASMTSDVQARLIALESRPPVMSAPAMNFKVDMGSDIPVGTMQAIHAGVEEVVEEVVGRVVKKEMDEMKVDVKVHIPEQSAPTINVKAPKVDVHNVVNVPQGPAPVVTNKVFVPAQAAPVVNFDSSRSDKALDRLLKLGERALEWFMNRKPPKRNIEFKFDKDGNLAQGTTTEEKR
jgi:hypothetical protein